MVVPHALDTSPSAWVALGEAIAAVSTVCVAGALHARPRRRVAVPRGVAGGRTVSVGGALDAVASLFVAEETFETAAGAVAVFVAPREPHHAPARATSSLASRRTSQRRVVIGARRAPSCSGCGGQEIDLLVRAGPATEQHEPDATSRAGSRPDAARQVRQPSAWPLRGAEEVVAHGDRLAQNFCQSDSGRRVHSCARNRSRAALRSGGGHLNCLCSGRPRLGAFAPRPREGTLEALPSGRGRVPRELTSEVIR